MDLYANERQTFTPDHAAAGRARHRGRRAARVLAVVRRLHHHELQLVLDVDHVPAVRLGRGAEGHPAADERRRDGDVPAVVPARRSRPAHRLAAPPGEGVAGRTGCTARASRSRIPGSSRRWPTPSRGRSGWTTRRARRPAPALVGEQRRRPGRGRRRLLRAVDRAAGQGGRPRPRRRAAGGRAGRLGRVRAQRRVLRGQPDPRVLQRAGPVRRTSCRPWSGWAGRTSTGSRPPSTGTASTPSSSAPASCPSPSRRGRSTSCGPPRPRPSGTASSWSGATGTRSRPTCTRRRTWAGCSSRTARWSTRPSWPGGWPAPARTSACGSTSARR